MCSHYQAVKKRDQLERYFRVQRIPLPDDWDKWPGYRGEFIRRPPEWDSGDEAVPERELVAGRWGLIAPGIPPAKQDAFTRKYATYNAKAETISQRRTYQAAWLHAQHCIIPAAAIFEPDHRDETKARLNTKDPVPTRFTRADDAPLGIAGLWGTYRDAAGALREAYTMITINADHHDLFKHYHRPGKEKRMVVILPDGVYSDWLAARPDESQDFLRPYPADALVAESVIK